MESCRVPRFSNELRHHCFDGTLRRRYLHDLLVLSKLVELSCRPTFSCEDAATLKRLGIEFVQSLEALFYKFDPKKGLSC